MRRDALARATRILGRLWLEELTEADLPALRAMPSLSEALPETGRDAELVDALAVEYQRLLGFNLPPYESVFLDPSAMMQAPATSRVMRFYREAGWSVPADARIGADDHLGAELLALSDLLAAGETSLASRLVREHLSLWLPIFVEALGGIDPHPFYASLAALTLGVVLGQLPEDAADASADARLPDLPELAQAVEGGSAELTSLRAVVDAAWQDAAQLAVPPRSAPPAMAEEPEAEELGLRRLVRQLATPRRSGLYITRQDIASVARKTELPLPAGERQRMLDGLLRAAGSYDAVDATIGHLLRRMDDASASYQAWAQAWPAWAPQAAAWSRRLAETRGLLAEALDRSEGETGPMPAAPAAASDRELDEEI